MNLDELKQIHIRQTLGILEATFPEVITFIDFANVNHWFDDDPYDLEGKPLAAGFRVEIDIQKLKEFLSCFSADIRFYYGHDPANQGSLSFITAARHIFGRSRVFTKRIQQIRHDLTPADSISNTRLVRIDDREDFVYIPKCNFDVEIAVDAMRLIPSYKTICLLSSDADFAALIQYLKSAHAAKAMLIKGGRIDGSLGRLLDLKIDASRIKSFVARIKQKPDTRSGSAES